MKNEYSKILEITEELSKENLYVRDLIVKDIYEEAGDIYKEVVEAPKKKVRMVSKLDNLVTSSIFGYPIMILLLAVVLWLTITGANVPSALLADGLFYIEDQLTLLFNNLNAPSWLHGILILGMFRTAAWVISVMLPPMAIFFPLFTLLEDLGYLPRVAFNLDRLFKKAGAHGKQSLTMCMVKQSV